MLDIIHAAGWPIWPLIFASIIAVAIIFERLWSLRANIIAPDQFAFRSTKNDNKRWRKERGYSISYKTIQC